jgi:MoxR-like ATPase
MAKNKVNKVTLQPMQINQAMNRVPIQVEQVERSEELDVAGVKTTAYRIRFKGLDTAGYVIKDDLDVVFHHYCEQHAGGVACGHMAYAAAIMDKAGIKLGKTYHDKDPNDFVGLVKDFVNYTDISGDFGVVPPVDHTPSGASTSSTATAAPIVTASAAAPIAKKRNWKDDWNDIRDYLLEERIDPSVITGLQNMRISVFNSVDLTTMGTEPVKPEMPYSGAFIGRAFRHLLNNMNLVLIGEKGSGKDTLINTIAWVLGLPIYLQPGNAGETKESIIGDRSFENGKVFFDFSPYATSVQYGGIASYPELNMIPGQLTTVFHSVYDENEVLGTLKGPIKKHTHHIFIGSMNVGEQYTGTSIVNGALMDRFAVMHMPYTLEFKDLLSRKSGLTDANALKFLEDVSKQIDELIATEGTGERSKTIRGYIAAARHFKKYGITLDMKIEALEDFILNKTEDKIEQFKMRDRIRQSVFTDLPKTKEEEDYENGVI